MNAMPDTLLLVEQLWAKASDILFITKEEYVRILEGWTIEPVHVGDELAFIFVSKGPEFHFDTVGSGHKVPMKGFRDFIQKRIDEHGYATTRTPVDDHKQQRLNRIFGFVETGRDHLDVHFRIEKFTKHFSERRV